MNAEQLLDKLTAGRLVGGTCLLSKKQSAWLMSVASNKEISERRAGRYCFQRMGRRFSNNNNGDVIHVSEREACELERKRVVIEQQEHMVARLEAELRLPEHTKTVKSAISDCLEEAKRQLSVNKSMYQDHSKAEDRS